MGARGQRRRRWRRAALAAVVPAAALALSACGDDAEVVTLTLPGPPPGASIPAPPPHPYQPPPIAFERGTGRTIGAVARARYVESTFMPIPSGFVPGGIPIGSRAGRCRVPEPTAADRAALRAAIARQTPRGTLQPLDDDDLLLADCGEQGRWALVTWTQVDGTDLTDWIDDLKEHPDGSWSGTARGVQPGCRPPRDAAAAWQLDVTDCRPKASPRAAPRPPPRARPAPRPRAPERLPFGSSRA